MNIGIIGLSNYLSEIYVPHFTPGKEDQIVAVCDPGKADAFAALQRAQPALQKAHFFTNPAEMIASQQLDVVLISSPHCYHYEQAVLCLEAGIHVMMDKPLACSYADALNLVEKAEQSRLKLAVAIQRRFTHAYRYAKEAYETGRLGQVKMVQCLSSHTPWGDYNQGWRGTIEQGCGGVLIDIGYLLIDTVLWMLNTWPQQVFASATPTGHEVEQSVLMVASLANGTLLNAAVSYECPITSTQEEFSIYGSQGGLYTRRFRLQKTAQTLSVIECRNNGEIHEVSFAENFPNLLPLENFLRSIKQDEPLLCSGRSHLPVMQFIDAAYQSLRGNRLVKLER
jgi:predicted dehydrogenase